MFRNSGLLLVSVATSSSYALLLSDLGVTKTHSRPYVSNDNPFSEAAFKTLKYRPGFPDRFGCEQDATGQSRGFFDWYNHHHRHGSLGLCTPYEVHHGLAADTLARRAVILDAAFLAHPERFPHLRPSPRSRPRSGSTSPTWRPRRKTLHSKFMNPLSQIR